MSMMAPEYGGPGAAGMVMPSGTAAPGPTPGPPAPPPSGGVDLESPEGILDAILQLAQLYRGVETDHQDILAIEKVTTLVQQILATRQQESDQMSGGRAMRRLVGG